MSVRNFIYKNFRTLYLFVDVSMVIVWCASILICSTSSSSKSILRSMCQQIYELLNPIMEEAVSALHYVNNFTKIVLFWRTYNKVSSGILFDLVLTHLLQERFRLEHIRRKLNNVSKTQAWPELRILLLIQKRYFFWAKLTDFKATNFRSKIGKDTKALNSFHAFE